MRSSRRHSAALYFFLHNAGLVFVQPYLPILWRAEGFSGAQIGFLSAVRPFVCSISGQLLVGIADSRSWHFSITVATYILTLATRGCMALLHGFVVHLLLVLVSEACTSPFMVITDAAIVGSTDAAGYARTRIFASVAWGGMAPLSGLLVGRWGVPFSIAAYSGFTLLSILPLVLLPLSELGCKRPLSSQVDAEELCQPQAGSKAKSQEDQHTELPPQLTGNELAVMVPDAAAGTDSAERISSKTFNAPLTLLLTTAGAAAAVEKTPPAKTPAAEASRPGASVDAAAGSAPGAEDWCIPAVGSPLRVLRGGLAVRTSLSWCQHNAVSDVEVLRSPRLGSPLCTPRGVLPAGINGASGTAELSPLARTASAASTAFYSVVSMQSGSNFPSGNSSPDMPFPRPDAAIAGAQPGSALLRHNSETATSEATPLLSTPRAAAGAGASAAVEDQGQLPLLLQQGSLMKQASNTSQALTGFDPQLLEDGAFFSPPARHSSPQLRLAEAGQAQAGGGSTQGVKTAAAASMEDRLQLPAGTAALKGSQAGSPSLLVHPTDSDDSSSDQLGDKASPAADQPAASSDKQLSVWGGIRRLLSNPRHVAFFALAWLMGIGNGCLGYQTLYLKESSAPGILLGVALLVNTCGGMPILLTTNWWLPKLGNELAFNVAMLAWVARLALYTMLPALPSIWCVLPVELLHGFTFAMAFCVGTVHAKAIAPPHLRSTTQSIFYSLYFGVGPGISGLAGGYIYQCLGMRWVFIIGAFTMAAGWAFTHLALYWATRRERTAAAPATTHVHAL